MTVALAFDVYGTLIDTQGLVEKLEGLVGEKASSFSRSWREKQLEYSFRRGLMQLYESFAVCTRQALDYTCEVYQVELTGEEKSALLDAYRTLPAFNDVAIGLSRLHSLGFRMFAFSNGTAEAVETLLRAAGIRGHFEGVVSVDDLKSFKPNPAVYGHFLRTAGVTGGEAWMVSSNPFDVIGARCAGMNAVWVKRSPDAVFDPWGISPTLEVTDLPSLADELKNIL